MELEQMAGFSDWNRLRGILLAADPPNLVLAGPAGIGKSCALRCILGSRVTMWLRCSQDPTLRDSRDRIKAASRRRVEAGQICWIVLEHADLLHTDAQSFLRRVIETTLGATRFVLEARDLAAIAEPLVSRCILFHAPNLVDYEIRAEILRRSPSVSVEKAGEIAAQSGGNVRWAVLQGLGCLNKNSSGLMDPQCPPMATVKSWQQLLTAMESIRDTGSSPRAAFPSDRDAIWERPGGADPWAILAWKASAQILT